MPPLPPIRIGQGYDVHRLTAGRPLILAGEHFAFPTGLDGHSDADVLTHAVMDALLGAAGLGDLGAVFGVDDPRYAGASSLAMLAEVAQRVRAAGWDIWQVDCTLIAERPKIAPRREAMRANLARAMGVEVQAVNVKAATTEGLGAIGRGEGMAAQAVALLGQANDGA